MPLNIEQHACDMGSSFPISRSRDFEQGNACKCTQKKHHIEIIKTKVWNDEFYEFVMTTIPSLYEEQPQRKLHI